MKAKELREKKKEDLEKILKEKRKELFKLRMELAERKLKNYKKIKQTKKDIARILTILKEKCQEKN